MMPDPPDLVDTHAHLDDPRLLSELPGVLDRARSAGVHQIVVQATSAASSEAVADLAEVHDGLFVAVGLHPNDVIEAAEGDFGRVERLVGRSKVVAIGETGLDRYWDKTPFGLQQESFARHLDLAARSSLPIVIHCRDSADDILTQLRELGRPVVGVLHSFTGDWTMARAFLDLGLHLGFAGQITFANKTLDPLRDAAARAPLDRLLVETDSPYLTPHPFRGRLNEPARVALTAARLADLRGLTPDKLAAITSANARRLFHLPEPMFGKSASPHRFP